MSTPKRCFVVMGFGIKTDLATGRKLNLDKSYQALIKPVVEAKGMTCIRADEIKHSGPIDLQMFQQLFSADLVIADLSTSNLNAFYELGIRHALKPHTTIIISEAQMAYPFNIQNLTIKNYTHLGDSIDYFEVLRFQQLLGETIDQVVNQANTDSPVYTLLNGLVPPSLQEQARMVAEEIDAAITAGSDVEETANDSSNSSLATLTREGELALKQKDFDAAKSFFDTALRLSDKEIDLNENSHNTYLIQRLALATYKAARPDYISALKAALNLLSKIDLGRTNDPETVAMAGSIEKHLYEEGQGDAHLENAILYYQRGYYLLHNRHNGINLAYLLHCRSLSSTLDPSREEQIADLVWANRFRRDVLMLCDRDAANNLKRETMASGADTVSKEQDELLNEQKFWILVNKAEAHYGLGEMPEYEAAAVAASKVVHEDWMMESFTRQLQKLGKLLEKPNLHPQ